MKPLAFLLSGLIAGSCAAQGTPEAQESYMKWLTKASEEVAKIREMKKTMKYWKQDLSDMVESSSTFNGYNIQTEGIINDIRGYYSESDEKYILSFILNGKKAGKKKGKSPALDCRADCKNIMHEDESGNSAFENYRFFAKKAKSRGKKVKVKGKYESNILYLHEMKIYGEEFKFR